MVVPLSLAGSSKEIINEGAIWKQETLLMTVEQGLPKNTESEQVPRCSFYKRKKIKQNPNVGAFWRQ